MSFTVFTLEDSNLFQKQSSEPYHQPYHQALNINMQTWLGGRGQCRSLRVESIDTQFKYKNTTPSTLSPIPIPRIYQLQ